MRKTFCLAVVLLLCVNTARAERGDQYLLPKFGVMSIDLNDADPLWSAGLMYGAGLSERISLEFEANYGFSGGKYERQDGNVVVESGDYRIWTAAGYGVYRLPVWQTFYLKGKVGLLYEQVTRNNSLGVSQQDDDFGGAGGFGAGVQFWKTTTLELEATVIDKNIVFYSLGTHVRFK